jgi:hypothetical protein
VADLGDTLVFSSDLWNIPPNYDSAGNITNGASLVNAVTAALTITLPDGTSVTPTITNPPSTTGKYSYHYLTSVNGQSGRYVGQWLFTMSGGETTSYLETFDVGGSLITVDEALDHLRANGVVKKTPDLDLLQWFCNVATDAVERDLGRAFTRRTIVESHDGGEGVVFLRRTPVLSVVSVYEGTVSLLPTTNYTVQSLADGGVILRRGNQYMPQLWWPGYQNVTVTYTVGYTDPPRIVRKVCLDTVQSFWQESQPLRPLPFDQSSVDTGVDMSTLTPVERSAYESLRVHG